MENKFITLDYYENEYGANYNLPESKNPTKNKNFDYYVQAASDDINNISSILNLKLPNVLTQLPESKLNAIQRATAIMTEYYIENGTNRNRASTSTELGSYKGSSSNSASDDRYVTAYMAAQDLMASENLYFTTIDEATAKAIYAEYAYLVDIDIPIFIQAFDGADLLDPNKFETILINDIPHITIKPSAQAAKFGDDTPTTDQNTKINKAEQLPIDPIVGLTAENVRTALIEINAKILPGSDAEFGDGTLTPTQATRAEDIVSVEDIRLQGEITNNETSIQANETNITTNTSAILTKVDTSVYDAGQLVQDTNITTNENNITTNNSAIVGIVDSISRQLQRSLKLISSPVVQVLPGDYGFVLTNGNNWELSNTGFEPFNTTRTDSTTTLTYYGWTLQAGTTLTDGQIIIDSVLYFQLGSIGQNDAAKLVFRQYDSVADAIADTNNDQFNTEIVGDELSVANNDDGRVRKFDVANLRLDSVNGTVIVPAIIQSGSFQVGILGVNDTSGNPQTPTFKTYLEIRTGSTAGAVLGSTSSSVVNDKQTNPNDGINPDLNQITTNVNTIADLQIDKVNKEEDDGTVTSFVDVAAQGITFATTKNDNSSFSRVIMTDNSATVVVEDNGSNSYFFTSETNLNPNRVARTKDITPLQTQIDDLTTFLVLS